MNDGPCLNCNLPLHTSNAHTLSSFQQFPTKWINALYERAAMKTFVKTFLLFLLFLISIFVGAFLRSFSDHFFAAFCGRIYQTYFFLLRWDQRSLVSFISTRTNISLSSHPANINQISRQILCDHQRNQQCVWNNRFQYLPHIFVLINILWAFVSIFLIPINYLMA